MRNIYSLCIIIEITALMKAIAIPQKQDEDASLRNVTKNNDETNYVPIFEEPPKCAGETTYCEDIDTYPTTLVERLLENTAYIFHDPLDLELRKVEIEKKTLTSDYEEVLCKTDSRIITPKVGLTANDGWLFIVNDNHHKQMISVEECRHMKVCQLEDKGNFFLPNGYEAKCKQRRLFVEMLVLLTNGTLYPKPVSMPSCCQCTFTKTKDWRP